MPSDGAHPDDPERTKSPCPTEPEAGGRLVVLFDGGFASFPIGERTRMTVGRASTCDAPVQHASVSRVHAAFTFAPSPAPGTPPAVYVEDLGSANGTKIGGHRLAVGTPHVVLPGTAVELGSVLAIVQLPTAATTSRAETSPPPADAGAVAADDAMARLDRTIDLVAPSDLPVLVLGETGAGKNVVAERIHRLSPRASRPLLPLNCGALAESLLESELFGHERGAFTGAHAQKPGLIESAAGGTVFLDEVAEMPPACQVKLLRVLENREVLRIGGRRPIPVDVRFVAATNRDLAALVETGAFRADLFYRISGVTLTIPPLRDRAREIAPLAAQMTNDAARKLGRAAPSLSPRAIAALRAHTWPGNVRELKSVVERAVLFAAGAPVIEAEHLALPGAVPAAAPAAVASVDAVAPAASDATPRSDLRAAIDDAERRRIEEALAQTAGNQGRAAELLGVSRRTLLRKLDEHGFSRPRKDTGR